jgi:hypothetical protein
MHKKVLWALVAVGAASASASAQTLFFSISPTEQNIPQNSSFTFLGSVTNTGASSLSLDSLDLSGLPAAFDIDAQPFITNFAGSLPAGASITNQPIFTVTVPQNFTLGSYVGSVAISQDTPAQTLAGLGFTVNVTAELPEPGTAPLVGLGVSMVVLGRTRRRKRNL